MAYIESRQRELQAAAQQSRLAREARQAARAARAARQAADPRPGRHRVARRRPRPGLTAIFGAH